MSYLTPDLTGVNELYKVDNFRVRVIDIDQTINFNDAVYLNSITVTLLGTTERILIKGRDWDVTKTNYDHDAMSAMNLLDNTFDKILVNSIVMIKPYVANYTINISYQKLYPVLSSYALTQSPNKLEFTPTMLYDILQNIQALNSFIKPIDNRVTNIDGNPLLLEIDPTKTKLENYIKDEEHQVDVPNNISIINPIAGSFYKDSLTVYRKDPVSDILLVEDIDYKVWDPNYSKTKNTNNKSGVYNFIVMIKPYVGTIKINYHAYGGNATLYDVKDIRNTLTNVIQYITDAQLLTADTVDDAPTISLIINKLSQLEQEMRRLAKEGLPSYGDVSSGSCLIKRIQSTDTDFHWWTIAELYKVAGSETVFIADTLKLHIETETTKFLFDAIISVNLDNPVTKFEVKVLSSVCPLGYVPFENYDDLDTIIRPQFRIIWNEGAINGSGIYLQIGMRLKGISEEVLAIEDWSGQQSCWKLIKEIDSQSLPEDNTIELPNTNYIWDIDNPNSKEERSLIPFTEGTIVWAGTEPLNRPAGLKHLELVHFLEDEIDISRISKIRCDLEEQGSGHKFPIYIDFIPGLEIMTGSSSFMYNGQGAFIISKIFRDTITNNIQITLDVNIESGLASNPLNLRQVIIYC